MTALLLACLMSFSAFADSSLLVGNAGEGVVVGEEIYLRDLYESGSHLSPQFDAEATPEITARVAAISSLRLLNVREDLLAAKISELNLYAPDLASYILAVIQYYHWVLVDSALVPFPDDGSVLRDKRVPLANRLDGTIRIHRPSWERLTQEHRVALVIHETLSAMQRLIWQGEGTWTVATSKLTEAVGMVFSAFSGKRERFRDYAERRLRIPSEEYRKTHPGHFEMRVRTYRTPSGTYQDTLEFWPGKPRNR